MVFPFKLVFVEVDYLADAVEYESEVLLVVGPFDEFDVLGECCEKLVQKEVFGVLVVYDLIEKAVRTVNVISEHVKCVIPKHFTIVFLCIGLIKG